MQVTDQFGVVQTGIYGRMIGPRYPHRWSTACENYEQAYKGLTTGDLTRFRVRITPQDGKLSQERPGLTVETEAFTLVSNTSQGRGGSSYCNI